LTKKGESEMKTESRTFTSIIRPLIGFKPSAAGKTYRVEMAARDELVNEDPFALAGTLTVNR
jgi:hypothetical protein